MNKFRNASNARLLQSMFYEYNGEDKSSVLFTLKDEDHMGFPSLYRLYMETDDPTEYTFATTHLDGWEHWLRLCESSFFKPYVARWRQELETRLRAKALLALRDLARADSKDSFAANKFLLQGSYKLTDASKRGRPTKDQVKQEAHRIASEDQQINSDLSRLKGLN